MDNFINNSNIFKSKVSGFSPVKSVGGDQKNNVFVKESINNFFDVFDSSLKETKFSWQDNIQTQIQHIEAQTAQYQDALGANKTGGGLDLTC